MNFISYSNDIKIEDIDLKTNLVGIVYEDQYVAYSWVGGCTFAMDYDDLLGNYVDSWNNIKLSFAPEPSDDDISESTLKTLENKHHFITEHIVQKVYIDEMKRNEEY